MAYMLHKSAFIDSSLASSSTSQKGDVLFVPAGCPHRVENLTDTLAVSCNYVDATNVGGALEALGDQASGYSTVRLLTLNPDSCSCAVSLENANE